MAVKRYENGAWVDASALRRFENGAWKDVGFARRYENGAWVDVRPSFAVGTSRTDFIESGIDCTVPLDDTPITCGYFENPVPPGTYTVEIDAFGWSSISRNDPDFNAYIYFRLYGVDINTGVRLFTVNDIASSSDSYQNWQIGTSCRYPNPVHKSFSVSTTAKIYTEAFMSEGYISANTKGYDTAWISLTWIRRDA